MNLSDLPKKLWHIEKHESIIAPFDSRRRLNLIPGNLYKLYCKRGYNNFYIKNNNVKFDVANQSILLFLSAEYRERGDWLFYFLFDNKTLYSPIYEDSKEFYVNFIEVLW